jgi:ORF6N domain
MFQLDEEEFANLRLQIATSSLKGAHGGRRYAPMAFTEHGATMASMVLYSPHATELSIYVVQAFVELRSMLATNRELRRKSGNSRHRTWVNSYYFDSDQKEKAVDQGALRMCARGGGGVCSRGRRCSYA